VGTDLAVLDERYLFAGANFLIYLGSTLPVSLLLGLFLGAIVYLPYRLLPAGARAAVAGFCRHHVTAPGAACNLGIVLGLALIQLCLRQCFFFAGLLVAPGLPTAAPWLAWLVRHDEFMPLYFGGLVLGLLVTAFLWSVATRGEGAPTPSLRLRRGILAALVAIEALFLPVNHGMLNGTSLPQVTAVGAETLPAGDAAWLVWEGKESVTYLVKRGGKARSLVTLPRSESKRIEIVSYANLPALLEAGPAGGNPQDAKP
jgi:hypothetical protein